MTRTALKAVLLCAIRRYRFPAEPLPIDVIQHLKDEADFYAAAIIDAEPPPHGFISMDEMRAAVMARREPEPESWPYEFMERVPAGARVETIICDVDNGVTLIVEPKEPSHG